MNHRPDGARPTFGAVFSGSSVFGKVRQSRDTPSRFRLLAALDDLNLLKETDLQYIVQEDGYREHAAMICPCGCRRVLHMNLLADERPGWQLTTHMALMGNPNISMR